MKTNSVTHLQQRQNDSLHKGRRLEQRLLHCPIQMRIQLPVFAQIVPDARQQNQIVESLSHVLGQNRTEDTRSLVHGRCTPGMRLGDEQNLFPIPKLRYDLECFGHFSTAIFLHNVPDSFVHVLDAGIELFEFEGTGVAQLGVDFGLFFSDPVHDDIRKFSCFWAVSVYF